MTASWVDSDLSRQWFCRRGLAPFERGIDLNTGEDNTKFGGIVKIEGGISSIEHGGSVLTYLAAQANRGLEGKFQLFLATLILPKLLVHFWQLLMEVSLRKAQVAICQTTVLFRVSGGIVEI